MTEQDIPTSQISSGKFDNPGYFLVIECSMTLHTQWEQKEESLDIWDLSFVCFFLNLFSVSYEECRATADWLLSRTQVRPTVGIVCGSGLGGLAKTLKDPQFFKYSDIPNFPKSTGMHELSEKTQQLLLEFVHVWVP